jgi:glycosyltransferase involved in cell wall biosynthesis
MIVKDEAHVIERCLASVRRHIQSWCIVDTGSSDRTKEVITKALWGIPGALYERPWVDFATNRNEAWELALANHRPSALLFIDADEVLDCPGDFPQPMVQDAYLINVLYQGQLAPRFFMVRADYPHRWRGKIHEDIEPHGDIAMLLGPVIVSREDGGRSVDMRAKLVKDLETILNMLGEDASNPRNWFYLGATYAKLGDSEQARKAFEVRTKMGGDRREIVLAERYLRETAMSMAIQAMETSAKEA